MSKPSVLIGLCAALVTAQVIFGPSASADASSFTGTWASIDTDGSHQTLTVRGASATTLAVTYFDDVASGACDGAPARITGRGVVDDTSLVLSGALVCLPGGDQRFRGPISVGYSYDSSSDTLTDEFGTTWYRTA